MSDLSLRLSLIFGALVVALVVSLALRMAKRRPVLIDPGTLGPGVYLFSSTSCLDCLPARSKLVERLGDQGFVELMWEREPDTFLELGIDAVPATVVVGADGAATLFAGMPVQALKTLNP
jgi:hypothetical protein